MVYRGCRTGSHREGEISFLNLEHWSVRHPQQKQGFPNTLCACHDFFLWYVGMVDIPTCISCVTIPTNALEVIKSKKPSAREWKFFPRANVYVASFNAF